MNVINIELFSIVIISILFFDYLMKNKKNFGVNSYIFLILYLSITILSLFNIFLNLNIFASSYLRLLMIIFYSFAMIPVCCLTFYVRLNFFNDYNFKRIFLLTGISFLVYAALVIFYFCNTKMIFDRFPLHILDLLYDRGILMFSLIPLAVCLCEYISICFSKRDFNKYNIYIVLAMIIPIFSIIFNLIFRQALFFVPGYVLSMLLIYIYKNNMAIFIDSLTGLYNRRLFEIESFKKVYQKNKMFACYIDVDEFKKINDTYGHNIGDVVLKDVSNLLKTSIRKNDYAIRVGGDEFLIIIGLKKKADKDIFANRIKYKIKEYNKNHKIKMSLSFGFDFYDNEKETMDEFIDRIDKKMYENKKQKKKIISRN